MSTNPDMSVEIGTMKMKNPVMVASGTFGYGSEYADVVDLNGLGGIMVKGLSVDAWEGNPQPRIAEVRGGLVNAIGLQNPGVGGFIRDHLPFLRQFDVGVVANIWGRTVQEYADAASAIDEAEGVHAVEVNISCPNIKEGGLSFGTDTSSAAAVIKAVRKVTDLPLIPKLSPNVPDIKVFARVAEECGADAVSLINSLPAMVIDTQTRRPVLGNVTGGLSGSAIHPVAVKMVWDAAGAVSIPVIGMGGITDANDALEFILAGASAVAVGTATFSDPQTAIRVAEGIERYVVEQGWASLKDAVGALVT